MICLGYKGYVIKEYFANYYLHTSDVTFDLAQRTSIEVHQSTAEPWRVTLVDTGDETMTGGRLQARRRPTSATRRSASPTATASPTSTSTALIEFHREPTARSRP